MTFIGIFLISVLFVPNVIAEEVAIPGWIKNNAGWWADGQIPDSAFLQGIQFLIKEGIMVIPTTETSGYSESKVPAWIKNNASWWADGHIDDNTFVSGIQYLVKVGIIVDPINEIKKLADEYWNCLVGDAHLSSNCLPFDEDYIIGGIDGRTYISGYMVFDGTGDDSNWKHDYHEYIGAKLGTIQDEDLHKQLFDMYVSITPKQILDEVVYFTIATDDYGGVGAVVGRGDWDDNFRDKYYLLIDPLDMAPTKKTDLGNVKAGSINEQKYKSVMIHENAHILSLGSSQSDNDVLFGEGFYEEVPQKIAMCAPNYYTNISGCMKSDSYLNLFFQEFWVDIYPKFKWYYEFPIHDLYLDHNALFYEKYKTQFVTEYAATNPDEDFAESFTAFVLKEKPSYHSSVLRDGDALDLAYLFGETADRKIRFFYNFPELVEMRDFIRNNL